MKLTDLLAHVRATAQQALIDAGSPDLDFTTSLIAAGSVAWDTCCGWMVVAPQRTFRYQAPFPTLAQTDTACEYGGMGVEISLVWLRCVPEVDDQGNAPSVARMQAAYDVILADHDTIWNALVGAKTVDMGGWELDRSDVSITWLGDQGGCVGFDARVSLGVDCQEWEGG